MTRVRMSATEKAILRRYAARGKELDTEVSQFKPWRCRNEVPQRQIGRYRPEEQRICATAEIENIEKYRKKKRKLPSFLGAGPRKYLYFDPQEARIGIVTPGGIAPGLNTVIHSIVHMHQKIYGMTKPAYGFLGGFRGLAEERFQELCWDDTIEWIHKGGTGLGSGRQEHASDILAAKLIDLGVDILYVIGGDGSLTAAHEIAGALKKREKEIVVAGIPKTMDNDVLWVWQSFGFDTAVAEATRLVNALHDEAKATDSVCLLVLFGRDAGFVAGHTALACGEVDVVLVPEVGFRVEPLLDYAREVVLEKDYALIVVGEGACPEGFSEKEARREIRRQGLDPRKRSDSRVSAIYRDWRLYLLRTRFEEFFRRFQQGRHRVLVIEPRHLIRAIPANSLDLIYCRRLVNFAVHNTLAGFTDFMISQWLTEYVLVPLGLVANKRKRITEHGIFWKTVICCTGQPSFD